MDYAKHSRHYRYRYLNEVYQSNEEVHLAAFKGGELDSDASVVVEVVASVEGVLAEGAPVEHDGQQQAKDGGETGHRRNGGERLEVWVVLDLDQLETYLKADCVHSCQQ